MLVNLPVICPICKKEFNTIIQYTQNCKRCGRNMSICTECMQKGHEAPEKCLICGGNIKSEADEMQEKYGDKFCF